MNTFSKDKKIIAELLEKLNFKKIKRIREMKSNQNYVFKIECENRSYIIKKFSKDAIRNKYDLLKRKKQIRFAKELNDRSIKTVLPIKFKNSEFIHYKNDYYLIYNYYEHELLKEETLKAEHIERMAMTLAQIHKLNLKINLPCHYKKINIDIGEYARLYENVDTKIYSALKNNEDILSKLIKECNENIKYAKKNMCISHNDYKILNMLWQNSEMYLIDFDASGMANPTAAMIESAFSLCKKNNNIDIEFLKLFIEAYNQISRVDSSEYKGALKVAMNGKLSWLSYILNKGLEEEKYKNELVETINELLIYHKFELILKKLEL